MESAKNKRYENTRLYKEIRKDLIEQLERNGTVGKYYEDLVDDYMRMWITKNLLIDDITGRGGTVRYDNGGGQSGMKKNESVDQLIRINAQKLKLLDSIGIKPSQSEGDDDDPL